MSELTFLLTAREGKISSLKKMLNEGVDVNCRDIFGNTALMAAASTGQLETVKFLLDKGIESESNNDIGESALSIARKINDMEVELVLWNYRFGNSPSSPL